MPKRLSQKAIALSDSDLLTVSNTTLIDLKYRVITGMCIQTMRDHMRLYTGWKTTNRFKTVALLNDTERVVEPQKHDQIPLWVASLESLNGGVLLERNHVSVKYPRSRALLVWCELWRRWKRRQKVPGRILNQVYGGFSVGIAGFVAFLPTSRFYHASPHGIGFRDTFNIINMNPQTRNIVVTQSVK